MTSPVDPLPVLMTGENSFIRLSTDGGTTMSDRTSHWRVLWCPAGTGHVLFMEGALTGGGPRIYSDNAAVARWLQRTIECHLHAPFADESIPIRASLFARDGDPRSTANEIIESDDDLIRMTWYDCIDPFVMHAPPSPDGRPIGVYTTFFPAKSAQLTLNGEFAGGEPWSETRGDKESSSAVLAWSETWVGPAG